MRISILYFLILVCNSLKVAVLMPGNVSDFGYNYAIFNGIQELKQNIPEVEVNYTESVTTSTCISVGSSYITSGFKLLIFPNGPFIPCAQSLAATYPTKYFVIQGPNITSSHINIGTIFLEGAEDARFLTGILSSKQGNSHTNKICVMIPRTPGFRYSKVNYFWLGSRYIHSHDTFHVGLTANFDDKVSETRVINHFLEIGCDVVIQHANTIHSQLLVANISKWGIGFASDMGSIVGPSVLSSVQLNWVVPFTYFTEKVLDSTFTNETFHSTIFNGGVTTSPYSTEVTNAARRTTDRARVAILSGKLTKECIGIIQDLFGKPCITEIELSGLYLDSTITEFDGSQP